MSAASVRRVRVMSWSLAGAAVLALTAALVFLGLNTERMAASRIGIYAILAVASECTPAPAA